MSQESNFESGNLPAFPWSTDSEKPRRNYGQETLDHLCNTDTPDDVDKRLGALLVHEAAKVSLGGYRDYIENGESGSKRRMPKSSAESSSESATGGEPDQTKGLEDALRVDTTLDHLSNDALFDMRGRAREYMDSVDRLATAREHVANASFEFTKKTASKMLEEREGRLKKIVHFLGHTGEIGPEKYPDPAMENYLKKSLIRAYMRIEMTLDERGLSHRAINRKGLTLFLQKNEGEYQHILSLMDEVDVYSFISFINVAVELIESGDVKGLYSKCGLDAEFFKGDPASKLEVLQAIASAGEQDYLRRMEAS